MKETEATSNEKLDRSWKRGYNNWEPKLKWTLSRFSCNYDLPKLGADLNGATYHTSYVDIFLRTTVQKKIPSRVLGGSMNLIKPYI